jgi:phenylacetate-CoA ligase
MSGLFWQAITVRDHLWHRRDLGACAAVIRTDDQGVAPPPDGRTLQDWGMPTTQLYPTGPAAMLAVTAPPAVQVAWLQRQRASYLLTLPTNLLFLARHCREHGIDLRLRGLSTLSEVVTPELRAICREVFGLELTDLYSARETGYIALQCPAAPHYHVQAEDMLVEILDEAGNDCAPGQMGRVVLTPLHEFATPLIRYDIGDLAEPGPPCACGRGLPVINRIYGRARNMLRLPSGELFYPGYSLYPLSVIPAVIQFQVVQRTTDRLDVVLAVRRPLTAEEEAEARAVLDKTVGTRFAYTISTCAEIARGPGGKYEDFRSEIVA